MKMSFFRSRRREEENCRDDENFETRKKTFEIVKWDLSVEATTERRRRRKKERDRDRQRQTETDRDREIQTDGSLILVNKYID